jgi:hypothetical protein
MKKILIGWLGILVAIVSASVYAQEQASTAEMINRNDLRFRPLGSLSEDESRLVRLPEGTNASQLSFRKFQIGADDAPPLVIAFEPSAKRIWADLARDGKLVELKTKKPKDASPSEQRDSLLVQTAIDSQPAMTAKDLWPTPSSIPIWLKYDHELDAWFIASMAVFDSQVKLNSRTISIRIEDRNSDGRFEGDQDLLKVDLNGDGKFDRIRESFPLDRYWRFEGQQYSLKWDRDNQAAALQMLKDFGSVAVKLDGLDKFEQLPSDFKVTLVSDTGIHILIDKLQPQRVPTGTYQVHSAVINWIGDLQWRMVFAKLDAKRGKAFSVQANQTTDLSILGICELTADVLKLDRQDNSTHLKIQPTLKSETGLYLTRSSSGQLEPSVDGTLIATVPSAEKENEKVKTLASGTTQFACGQFCPIELQWPGRDSGKVLLAFDSGPLTGPMLAAIEFSKETK